MSKLDEMYGHSRAVSAPGHAQHYLLGAELWYRIFNYVADLLLSDCSGYIISILRRMGVLFRVNDQWVGYAKLFGTQRPTANGMYKRLKGMGLTFPELSKLLDGKKAGAVFKVKVSTDRATHVGFFFGYSDNTCESGDGTGHVAFHKVQRWLDRCPQGYKIVFAFWPENDMGALTPIGQDPTPLHWRLDGTFQRQFYGDDTRELNGVLYQVVKNRAGLPSIGTGAAGRLFGEATRQWVVRFQKEQGLRVDGVVTRTVCLSMQRELRKLVGA